jgi:hypothetical protein
MSLRVTIVLLAGRKFGHLDSVLFGKFHGQSIQSSENEPPPPAQSMGRNCKL